MCLHGLFSVSHLFNIPQQRVSMLPPLWWISATVQIMVQVLQAFSIVLKQLNRMHEHQNAVSNVCVVHLGDTGQADDVTNLNPGYLG